MATEEDGYEEMTPFTIGADTACTGTVCGTVSRGAREWALPMSPVPAARGRAFRWPLTATR